MPFPPLRVRVRPGKFREPDILFLRKANFHRRTNRVWNGADLVMEVVSDLPKDRDRDLVTKRADYARAGVPEYWIVDPQDRMIRVLTLGEHVYDTAGEYADGETARSVLLPGFNVETAAIWALERHRK